MKTVTASNYAARILKVLIHIQHHLDEPLRLDDLAGIACFSPYHFHRVFRGMVGESLGEHIKRIRLERAAHMLRYSQARITEIALDTGYEATESFSRAFKDVFGCAPTAYRCNPTNGRGEQQSGVHFVLVGETLTFQPIKGIHNMDVTVQTIDPVAVAFVRHTGPYSEVGAAWGKLCAWAGPNGLLNENTRFFGLSYDDPDVTAVDKIRYDACCSIDRPELPEGDVGFQEIPGGTFAVVVHEGAFDGLKNTYAWLMGTWMPDSGYEPGACPSIELYLNDPETTAPEDLRTEIRILVNKR
jgi:AraC family transcriptional regulator